MSQIEIIPGLHSVQALLKTAPQRVLALKVLQGRHDQRMQKLLALANKHGLAVQFVDKKTLDSISAENHQGVIAEAKPGEVLTEKNFYAWLDNIEETPFLLVLDGVTDPHNLGACMRSADAAGVHAVIIPKDNSAGLNEVARKVASGAAETLPLVAVTNLVRVLQKLKEKGLWVSGAAGEAEHAIYQADLSGPRVVVLGAEGSGLRRLTRENCDELVKIPMFGTVGSLNVSVACGIILFEVCRQRGQLHE